MKNDKYKPGDLVRYVDYTSSYKPIIIIEERESIEYPTYKIFDIHNKELTWEMEHLLVPINKNETR